MRKKLSKEERLTRSKLAMHKAIANYRRQLTNSGVKCECKREDLTLICLKHMKIVSSGKCPICDGLAGVNTDYIEH